MKMKLLPLFLIISQLVFAQNPGGVSGSLSLWVRSNSGTSTTGALVDSWTYVNDGTKFYSASNTDRPSLVSNVINFNPAIRFTGGLRLMDGPVGTDAPVTAGNDAYSVFVVWKSNINNAFQRVWSQRTTNYIDNSSASFATWDGSFPGPGVYGDETATAPFSHTIVRGYNTSAWNISQLNLLNQATNDLEVMDNLNFGTGPTLINTDPGGTPNGALIRNIGNTVHRIGASFDNSGPLDGDIAEIIVYDGSISGANRTKVFSYLAMKYGVSLGGTMTNSAGTTIWDATTNTGFNNAIFGVGRDDNSGLSVSQSNSVESGSGDGTGQSAKGNILLSNPSSLDDNDFLVIGNDNAALTESVSSDVGIIATGSKRLAREWKVQHTGNAGTIRLQMDFNGLSVSGTNYNDFRIMIDEDGDGDFTTGVVRYYTPGTYAAGIATFNGITLNNGEVFTFLTVLGGQILPVTWKDFTVKLNSNNDAVLNWKVDNNKDANNFSIEHSVNGINYSSVGTVNNNPAVTGYSYTDRGLAAGSHFYRIRETDLNGRATVSNIIKVNVKATDYVVSLLNNPVKDQKAVVSVRALAAAPASFEIWTASGTKVNSIQQELSAGSNRVSMPLERIPAGNYILRVIIRNEVHNIQLVKL
jgi:hypothetical protein